jgi:putative acetyltransferase
VTDTDTATTVTIRPETRADEAIVRDVVTAAFGGERVPELLDGLRACDAWRGLSFVAEQGGEVVGHTCFTRGWVDAPDALVEVLVLSPMSVRPDRQRAGVGSTLITSALETLAEADRAPLVFLEGDPRYYSRLGFVAGTTLGFTAPSVRIPAAAFQVVTLPSYRREMTGALVYPDVFWRYDATGLRP